ncbi:MAG TPA: RES family NAD+ phosphorylase [Gemmatimonadales bacterium]|jgi:RES domain-containing protein|nr:RES family NAD+ phosphorylase [Gemmatimonadales bacterium]
MRVWRVARRIHAVLDGEGARRAGGRWNSPGMRVVYTSSTLSLSVLELLVHTDPDLIPRDLRAFEIESPESVTAEILDVTTLPANWRQIPNHPGCRAIGDAWLEQQSHAVLGVPSAVVPEELNYLINPTHPDAALIQVVRSRAFSFDERLF